jgi:leader peptidase (prepilin peptidase) / N-methyltransferase
LSDPISLFYGILIFLLGACLGSFANVIIYRMPKGESVVKPRSRCNHCGTQIQWKHNIPILSWILLRGKCAYCGAQFSARYPLVELVMALSFLTTFIFVGFQWVLFEYLLLFFGLIVVSVIDLDHMILPDEFTLSGIVIGLIGAVLNPERQFIDSLFGVLLGGGFLWTLAALYQKFRGEEGMGGGDIKLIAWLGAVLGWKAVPFIILSSSVIGSIAGLVLVAIQRKGLKTAIPFGPYLALGGALYVFGGEELGRLYIQLLIPGIH